MPGGVQGLDRYAYVNNNPLVYVDPSGHDAGLARYLSPAECLDKSAYTEEAKKEITNALYNQTVMGKAQNGDKTAILKLITPTHAGVRGQTEISLTGNSKGVSVTLGGNLVYNRVSGELATSLDITFEGGLGTGEGDTTTVGPLLGYGSSDVSDVTEGNSYLISATGAYIGALSVGVSTPNNNKLAHGDFYSGITPFTIYSGAGGGGDYAGVGLGFSKTLVSITILSLPSWLRIR